MAILPWLWFGVIQAISLIASVLGWVLLIPFCLTQSWGSTGSVSIKDPTRQIDTWSWKPLNYIYGNPEDGVSGQQAKLIGGGPYMPDSDPIWRAYCWSALRNSADNLKYVFAWEDGPFVSGTILGKGFKLGWQRENGIKVPVLSLG